MKQVSVIVPAWRAEKCLGDCLDSLLAQSADIEVLAVDDGSDDRTGAIIDEYAARRPDVAIISAVTGEGVEAARALMASQLTAQHKVERIFLRFDHGEAMAWLHARGEVLSDLPEGEGHMLTVRLDPADRARFERLWPPSVA